MVQATHLIELLSILQVIMDVVSSESLSNERSDHCCCNVCCASVSTFRTVAIFEFAPFTHTFI